MMIRFFVPGIPRPGGSKRAIPIKGGRVNVVDASKYVGDWKATVSYFAHQTMQAGGVSLFTGPVSVHLSFRMPRPKHHYSASRALKPSAPKYHSHQPDWLKLSRSTEDAMTGIVWRDDGQGVQATVEKLYVVEEEPPGCWVEVADVCDRIGSTA